MDATGFCSGCVSFFASPASFFTSSLCSAKGGSGASSLAALEVLGSSAGLLEPRLRNPLEKEGFFSGVAGVSSFGAEVASTFFSSLFGVSFSMESVSSLWPLLPWLALAP